MKKIGTISYATESGLGIIAKDFTENGIFDKILIVRHEHFENHFDWYPDAQSIRRNITPTDKTEFDALIHFINEIDILVVLESPWNPYVIPLCRQLNKKIVLMPNHEWTPWPLDVDFILCPSELEKRLYTTIQNSVPVEHINIPVNSRVKWRQRTTATSFLHNSGRGSSNDRNGTILLSNALPHVHSQLQTTIRGQGKLNSISANPNLDIKLINHTVDFESLYSDFDIFIFVERFCGSSLPLQEAFASGLAIISGDRFPINTWLPKNTLVKPIGYEKLDFIGIPFDAAVYDPEDLAKVIDRVAATDISKQSLAGKEWGELNSWNALREKYITTLQSI
jgi:hypothetical protein